MYQGPEAYASKHWNSLMGRVAEVGDLVLVGGEYRTVQAIVDWAPGEHPDSPIKNELPARQWFTFGGSRWSGMPCGIKGSDDDLGQ